MFKLSIGGYYVLGAYAAFWLNKVFYQPFNDLGVGEFSGSSQFYFGLMMYLPILLFIALLAIYFKLYGLKTGIGITIVNSLLFIIQRSLIVSNFNEVSFEATLLAFVVQDGILVAGFAMYYLELSQKQVLGTMGVLNILVVFLSLFDIFPKSPAVYISILIFSILFVSSISMLIDRYFLDEIRDNSTIVLVITFGIALLIQSIIPLFKYPENGEFIEFGIDPKTLDGMVLKFETFEIFGATIQLIRVIAAIIAIFLLISIYLFINKTPMGRAMEAVSEDPDAAWLVGINVRKVYLISTGLGMGLSAAAGVVTSPFAASPSWTVYMGWTPLIFAIAVVTLGGIGSIFGSAIAGFILGLTEVTIAQIDPKLGSIVPLLAIFIILLVRPNGLFGVEEDE